MVTSRHWFHTLVIFGGVVSLSLLYSLKTPLHFVSFVAEQPIRLSCEQHLVALSSLGLHGMIIDVKFLQKCQKNETFSISTLEVAVDVNLGFELLPMMTNANKNLTVHVISYFNDTSKDYWTFLDDGQMRAIPRLTLKNISNFEIPIDVNLFSEYWSRSRMLECKNIDMKRNDTNRYQPIPYSFEQMALLRDLLVSYRMFPFLLGGSLLGWYRECSIIPHTGDSDFAVFIEQFNPEFEIDILAKKTNFSLWRKLGMTNDSFEYTAMPNDNYKLHIDIFFMYKEDKQYWVGGTGGNGEKYRYYYPDFVPNCSAALGGHLFWVTCDPDKMLQSDYGAEWRKDHPTSRYSWNSSGRNVKKVGQWPKELMNNITQYF